MAQLPAIASPLGLRALWASRSKRVPTILAPALPALVLLAITTAGMVDPPRAGLAAQLHLTAVRTAATANPQVPGQAVSSLPVTPR